MRIEGRQKLNAEAIEAKSILLLNHFNPNCLKYVKATPLLEIASFLEQSHGIIFRFDGHLGFSEKGFRLLGAFNPKKKVILVDAALKEDEHKFNFTLAHELGHLALHRQVKIIHDSQDSEELPETINEWPGNKNVLHTESDWLEWQANYYASCLLMPKNVFIAGLMVCQERMGISRRGRIYVDDQPSNQKDYWMLISNLSDLFRVSKTAIQFRLFKLNLVEDNRKSISVRDLIKGWGL